MRWLRLEVAAGAEGLAGEAPRRGQREAGLAPGGASQRGVELPAGSAEHLFAEGAVAVEREGDLLVGWYIDEAPPQARAAEAPHWAAEWLAEQRIVRVSEKVSVGPAFIDEPALVRVNPGLAFGTGTHATTFLCLQALEPLSPGRRVLDVGTGTGVLAIAALKLGARSALGTDIDPVALRTAARVARQNGVELGLAPRAPVVSFN